MVILLTGLLLFLPHPALCYFGVDSFATKYRGAIAIVFFFSFFLLVSLPIDGACRNWSEKRKIRKYLRDATVAESNFVRRCLLNNGSVIHAISDIGVARGLEKKDVVWESSDEGIRGNARGYSLTHSANAILKEPEFGTKFTPEKKG